MNKVFLIFLLGIAFFSCKEKSAIISERSAFQIKGETMGTYYVVKYVSTEERLQKAEVDSLLTIINSSINTYNPQSVISKFNQTASVDPVELSEDSLLIHYFIKNYQYAQDIYTRSGGAYDPTITPLVNHWGFGYVDRERARNTDPAVIKELLKSVGFEKLNLMGTRPLTLQKNHEDLKIDFSSVAKGQAVDEIGALLESGGIEHYYIEIGGECRARGKKTTGPWVIGISFPDTSARVEDIITQFPLNNLSVASSGNYRNYYTSGGTTYGHTINPKTGFPEWNDLLSASVFTSSCGYADAIATACMALGSEKSLVMIEDMNGVEAYLVAADKNGKIVEKYSSGASALLSNK